MGQQNRVFRVRCGRGVNVVRGGVEWPMLLRRLIRKSLSRRVVGRLEDFCVFDGIVCEGILGQGVRGLQVEHLGGRSRVGVVLEISIQELVPEALLGG